MIDIAIIGGGWSAAFFLLGLSDDLKQTLKIEIFQENSPSDEGGLTYESLLCSVNGQKSEVRLPAAKNLGGASISFGGQLSRFEKSHFSDKPGVLVEEDILEPWPIKYSDLSPHYEFVENYVEQQVGSNSKKITLKRAKNSFFFQQMVKCKIDPYVPLTALNFKKHCDGCPGRLCKKKCKFTALDVILDQEKKYKNIKISNNSKVVKISSCGRDVRGVKVLSQGEIVNKECASVVLCAGAINTPEILNNLYSSSGIDSESSKFVGRGLMFHYSDIYISWDYFLRSSEVIPKFFASDFLNKLDGVPLGNIQSIATTLKSEDVQRVIFRLLPNFNLSFAKIIVKSFAKISGTIAEKMSKRVFVLATVGEDFPRYENKVKMNDKGKSIIYSISSEMKARRKKFDKTLKKNFRRKFFIFRLPFFDTLNLGHPCGTCRMAEEKSKGVVNKNCKSFDFNNLYIVDASILPRSGGTNPSLTIAANAHRAASLFKKTE